MKKVLVLFLLSLVAQMFSATYTVDGYAFLEGETDHSGIEVFFQRVAPDSLFSYTVNTDSSGYYTKTVENGIYDINYSKSNYRDSLATTVEIYSNMSFGSLTLKDQSVIPSGIHYFTEDLTISLTDTLIIEPGAKLIFYPGAGFDVYGYLIAEGTVNDSIYFTSLQDSTWDGITFMSSSDNSSIMEYSVIENSNNIGLKIDSSSPTINNCTIQNNSTGSSQVQGGGIYISNESQPRFYNCTIQDNMYTGIFIDTGSTPEFISCNILRNESSFDGFNNNNYYAGGIKIQNAEIILDSTVISDNKGYIGAVFCNEGEMSINNTMISNNQGSYTGGVHIEGSLASLKDTDVLDNTNDFGDYPEKGSGGLFVKSCQIYVDGCKFSGNTSVESAGGIWSVNNKPFRMSNSIIDNNYASNWGGGVWIVYGSAIIENCIFKENTAQYGAGIGTNMECGSIYLVNNTITGNYGHGICSPVTVSLYNSIVSNNSGYGFYNYYISTTQVVEYCNIFNNAQGNYYQCNEYLGLEITENSNGTPCDAWNNISIDPMFLDDWNGDYMLTEGSPCIDAGKNTITDYTFPQADLVGNYRIWDGDGDGSEIVDMGAYEYGSISVGIETNEAEIYAFELYQNYPNPFNPVTSISYALPKVGQVELNVYNLQGQLVQSLANEKQDKGIHKAEFNASDLTSGMYIYSLKVDGKVVQSRKMMMLK